MTVTNEYVNEINENFQTNRYAFLCQFNAQSITFDDSDITGNDIAETGHPFVTGQRVQAVAGTGGLPSPLTASTNYWIISVDANNIALAASLADARTTTKIALTAGSGTGHSLTEQTLDRVDGIEAATFHELDSNGADRQQITKTPVYDEGADQRSEANVTINFTASGGNIVATHICSVVGGTGTSKNTTGTLATVDADSRTIVDPNSQPFSIDTIVANVSSSTQGV